MTARRLISTLLILTAIPAAAPGQKSKPLKGGREYNLQVEVAGAEGMGYHLHLPRGWKVKSKKKYPVLIVLHGNGGAPERTLQVFRKLSTKKTQLILIAPGYQKERRSGAPAWPETVCTSAFSWLFEKATTQWHGDPDRRFIQGFSMGGSYASYYARALDGTKDKAAVRGVILNSGVAYGGKEKWPAGVPSLFVVGEQETDIRGTNYVKVMKQVANSVFRTGADVRHHLMAGMGHTVNDKCVELVRRLIFEECRRSAGIDKDIAAFKKRLKKNPRRLTDFLQIERLAAALPKGSRADRINKSVVQLSDHPLMVRDREAWKLLAEARKADRPDNPDRKKAYAALARSHPKTEAGRIAKDRVAWID